MSSTLEEKITSKNHSLIPGTLAIENRCRGGVGRKGQRYQNLACSKHKCLCGPIMGPTPSILHGPGQVLKQWFLNGWRWMHEWRHRNSLCKHLTLGWYVWWLLSFSVQVCSFTYFNVWQKGMGFGPNIKLKSWLVTSLLRPWWQADLCRVVLYFPLHHAQQYV